MTRELNKQWRDDQRPSFRNTSSNSRGDERFSRPARPRLNREVVDRAWKDGAQPHHSDYHPRTSNRPYAQNGRNGQRSEYSSSQSRPGHNNFNSNRRDNAQRFERPSSNYQDPRSRSFESDGRYPDDRRFGERNDYNRRPYDRRGRNGNRPYDMQDYRDRGRNFGSENTERYEHPRQGPNAPRGGGRTFARDDRQRGPRRFPQNRRYQEQFEGDYEHFTGYNEPKQYDGRPRQSAHDRDINNRRPEPDRHVTQMADGRVLKGSRPEQRRQAQFWTEVTNETEDLVQKVQAPTQEPVLPSEAESAQPQKNAQKKRAASPRRASSAAERKKNVSPIKSHGSGPRPSQKGFKWPTA
jgi:hypothetical protein